MKLNNRKASGLDDITNEILQKLTTFLQKITRTWRIPEEWRQSITVFTYKKGKKTNPNNYRTTALLINTAPNQNKWRIPETN